MNRAFDNGLVIGAGLVIALLILDAGLSYRHTRELHDDAQLVSHTSDTLEALDGEEALAAATALQPNLLLLNIGLPGKDGFEVARQIRTRAELARTTIVALTGYGMEEVRRQSRAAGFDQHIIKPIDLEKLHRLLASPPGRMK